MTLNIRYDTNNLWAVIPKGVRERGRYRTVLAVTHKGSHGLLKGRPTQAVAGIHSVELHFVKQPWPVVIAAPNPHEVRI